MIRGQIKKQLSSFKKIILSNEFSAPSLFYHWAPVYNIGLLLVPLKNPNLSHSYDFLLAL